MSRISNKKKSLFLKTPFLPLIQYFKIPPKESREVKKNRTLGVFGKRKGRTLNLGGPKSFLQDKESGLHMSLLVPRPRATLMTWFGERTISLPGIWRANSLTSK